MSQILRLRGRNALSAFRTSKLVSFFRSNVPRVTAVHAEFWHFVQLARALSDTEAKRLERILSYGPADAGGATHGELLLVVPRIGTISPWSSKATDIARHCGLEAVHRIERGVAYFIVTANGEALSPGERAALLPLVHDRMTETVMVAFDEAARLLQRFESRPLVTVDILNGGLAALERANRDMGLALSQDEIEYLVEEFKRVARNPTGVRLLVF